jgi:hypothetical protein
LRIDVRETSTTKHVIGAGKNMKKLLLLGVVLSFAASALAIPFAGQATVGRTAGTYGLTGGEYTISPVAPTSFTPFQSFCLEIPETAASGWYTLDTVAINGGGGPNPDPISIGTAWLFAQFSAGTLFGYDYTIGAGRQASAYALQLAFWNLEQESAYLPAPALAFLNLAQAAFPNQNIFGDDNGKQGVYAMNFYDSTGKPLQSMLAVPDGGSMLALLGIALLGLQGFFRFARR